MNSPEMAITTAMNVSIAQIVEDLNTTVAGRQAAITVYTLVMAVFVLMGGPLPSPAAANGRG